MPIVLDSSLLVAVRNERDDHHKAALHVMDRILDGAWGQALLLEYVVVESTSAILKRCGLGPAIRAAEDFMLAEEFEFVPCSDLFAEAHRDFTAQRGTDLSIPDQAIVAIARARGAERVATFDQGFRKVKGLKVVPAG